jgi:two-component system, OmpR family, sensor histidine kinase MprB
MSLRRRLALLSAAAVAVAVLLVSGIVYALVRDRLRSDVDEDLERQVERSSVRLGAIAAVAGAADPGGPVGTFERAVPAGPPTSGEGPAPAIGEGAVEVPPPPPGGPPTIGQVVLADGKVIAIPGSPVELPVSSGDRELAQAGGEPRFEDIESGGTTLRVLTQPVGEGAALQVARSLEDTERTLETLILILAIVSAGGVALAAGLGPVVARTALAPAADVSEAAEEVARTQDLTRRIEVRGEDELARLAGSFNEMMAALERSEAAQRRLVADASHELRTPLATLRANIETLARDREMDGVERDRLVSDVTDELEELTELVADVVELARLPAENGGVERETLSLDELARDAVERARRRARGLRFSERFSPTLVHGDRQRLGRAISNLLDNACKWSPDGGEIEVAVKEGSVSVRDHGPGFEPDDLPKVFDRFWRADDARGKPGSGLGLAIVQRVAEEHGGRARAANADGGGAEIRLELPTVPAEDKPAS